MFKVALRNSFRRLGVFSTRKLSVKSNAFPKQGLNNFRFAGLTALTIGSMYYASNVIHNDSNVQDSAESVEVDSSVDPFPFDLKKNENVDTDYELLGFGVRSVTFVGFKVYAVGVYIAKQDREKAKNIMSKYIGLDQHLHDPDQSTRIVNDLLENGVKFAVRICPVRNTDYNHMKDGFIKSILAHPKAKEFRDEVGQGLQELRTIFQLRKGTVPKNHVMLLQVLEGGKLNISYQNTSNGKCIDLGTVNEPLVSNLLLLQYLSGKKPLSAPLRDSCINGFLSL